MQYLEPADLLEFRGPDALAFAQAQFCADTRGLADGTWQWNAWLDPKGRVRHFFALLHAEPECLLAWLPPGSAEPMRASLLRFVFRARLHLALRAGWALHAGAADAAPDARRIGAAGGGHALRMPGLPGRVAVLAPHPGRAAPAIALEAWRHADIEAGLPWLAPILAGEFLPQSLALERLDAIQFDKGCYPGQEVAARVHFRGGNKRHLHRLRLGAGPLPAAGTQLVAAGSEAARGRVLYAAARDGLVGAALAVLAGGATDDVRLCTADGTPVTECVRVAP